VAKKAVCSVAEVIAVWACLLEAASAAEARGNPGKPDFEALDCALGLADGLASAIYTAMVARQLVDGEAGTITSWEKRQPRREREDSSAERVRALRGRKNGVTPCNATTSQVTPEDEHVTPCNTISSQETPRGEESREELTPPFPPSGGKSRVSFQTFMQACREKGEKAISDYQPVWTYAEEVALPREFIELAWREFKRRCSAGGIDEKKRQADWRQTFRTYVEKGYMKLWYIASDGKYALTTAGLTAQKATEST